MDPNRAGVIPCPALAMKRLPQLALVLAAALHGRAAVLTDDFSNDPTRRGWKGFGDTSLFRWNNTNQNLEVTWDSSRTNSFLALSLGTVLAKTDDFSFHVDLVLRDIRAGSTPGKSNEFEIAIGLFQLRNATNANSFRGAGVSSTYGVRNIIEFNYFPDAGFGDTWATTAVSSNNVFAFGHTFPLTLTTGDVFQITLSYSASNQLLRTTATKNGSDFGPFADVSLVGKPDFRVDSFAVTSYSDAVQTGLPAFHGSVLAHGTVDNVSVAIPPLSAGPMRLSRSDGVWRAEFQSRTNWLYTLERSPTLSDWTDASAPAPGNGSMLGLNDSGNPGPVMFYRVRAERP